MGAVQKRVLSSTANTIAIRVSSAAGGQAGGLIAAFDTSAGAAGDLLDMAGADLTNAGGFLCTANGTIQASYVAVGGGGTTVPQVMIEVAVVAHEQLG